MTPTQICSHCGAAAENLTAFDGQLLCPDCLEQLTATCADCGGRFWRRDCRGNDEAAPVCCDCFQQNYVRCTRCGHAVHTDNCWYPLDNAVARVLYFVERHWAELLRFSRRTQRQLDQWAARYGYRDRPGEMLEHVKKGSGGRYTCVNPTNCDTIEFRMFRGTLKLNTFIATLQMVNHICDAAIFLSDDELHDLSWSGFVSGITEPELVQYLKERNLYVNEPVTGEGEV